MVTPLTIVASSSLRLAPTDTFGRTPRVPAEGDSNSEKRRAFARACTRMCVCV